MKTRLNRALYLAVALLVAVVLSGCSATSSGPEPDFSRDFGATDPCQFTTLELAPRPGVDLSAAGQRLVDGFEGYQDIGEVRFFAGTSTLEVTWCNAMQTEQGVLRAVSLTNLVTVDSVTTQPNTR